MPGIPAILSDPRKSIAAQQLRQQGTERERAGRSGSSWLIAPGRTLEVPRLEGVAVQHPAFGSDQAAAKLAAILLELNIAKPADWRSCGGEPQGFIARALDRFVRSHGESNIDGAFELCVAL